jgi:ribosomal protein L32
MSAIEFTENYEDLSTDTGYQFKFFCDRCHNGYMTGFQMSATRAAGGLLRSAGSMFGSVLGNVGDKADEIQRLAAGPAHDKALQAAVAEIKPKFNQCPRCGRWVCQAICWNVDVGLCADCAPKLEGEIAVARSDATIQHVRDRAYASDLGSDIDVKAEHVVTCPHCGAQTEGGRFCASCGGALSTKKHCTECGQESGAAAKFCPNCGNPQTG